MNTNYTNGLGNAVMTAIAFEVAQLLQTDEVAGVKKRDASESSMTAEEVKQFRNLIVDASIQLA